MNNQFKGSPVVEFLQEFDGQSLDNHLWRNAPRLGKGGAGLFVFYFTMEWSPNRSANAIHCMYVYIHIYITYLCIYTYVALTHEPKFKQDVKTRSKHSGEDVINNMSSFVK